MNEEIGQSGARSTVDRVKGVLRFEPGIFSEIAEDSGATGQACVVFAVAVLLGSLWGLPAVLIAWPLGFIGLAIVAGLFQLVARLFAGEGPTYAGWLRAVLFATAPVALGVIPLLGTMIGAIFNLILQIVAIRDVSGMSTGAAVMTWIIAMAVPLILVFVGIIALGFSILGMFGLGELFS